MNSTYDTLFALLRAALHGDEISKVPNFSVLLQEARKQTVDGLLYALPEIRVSDEERPVLLQWIAGMPRLEQANREMEMHAVRLSALFEKKGVRHAIMKGQTCAVHYPHPLLRRSGDIDVYVAPKDFEKACSALEALQFEKDDVTMHHTSYRKGLLDIELHWVLQRLQWPSTHRRLREMLTHEVDECKSPTPMLDIGAGMVHVLPPELNMVLLTAHPFTHIVNEGLGLRQVVDWMMVFKNTRTQIDIPKLYVMLKELRLLRVFRMLAYLCCTYLGMDKDAACITPDGIAYSKQDGKRGERVLEWIIESGNFGHAMKFGEGKARTRRFYSYFLRNCLRFFWLNPTEMIAWPWMKCYRFVTGQNHLHDD